MKIKITSSLNRCPSCNSTDFIVESNEVGPHTDSRGHNIECTLALHIKCANCGEIRDEIYLMVYTRTQTEETSAEETEKGKAA